MLGLPEESEVALMAVGAPVEPMLAPPKVRMERARIPLSTALSSARHAIPNAQVAWIETPAQEGGWYRLRMQVRGDPSARFPHSYVWVNPYSGEILASQRADAAPAGTVIMNWLHPLHDGSAGGLFGRILVAISGLLPLALFLTGWMRYRLRQKRAAH